MSRVEMDHQVATSSESRSRAFPTLRFDRLSVNAHPQNLHPQIGRYQFLLFDRIPCRSDKARICILAWFFGVRFDGIRRLDQIDRWTEATPDESALRNGRVIPSVNFDCMKEAVRL